MEQYYGTGRRKTSVARVFLRPGKGKVTVNGLEFQDYFGILVKAVSALEPLRAVDATNRFDAYITVEGGGKSGQVDAI
ncbi:30S ribosomal protein S9, partial [Escherichia coli]|nr:30S ribosomal protein S9 [Escherichia coli]